MFETTAFFYAEERKEYHVWLQRHHTVWDGSGCITVNAAELFVDCLEAEEVEYVFGLPGEQSIDVMDALSRSDIEFVVTRHEQGAAFMADVYGRLTGDAGVCLATLGPGATNLATGVTDANLDSAPLVAITSQRDREDIHKNAHQYIDVVSTFEQLTTWNESIQIPESVPEIVRKAFDRAETERSGATHIELPRDVGLEETDAEPLPTNDSRHRNQPSVETLDEAVEKIEDADHPLIIAGNGVIRSGASEELRAFAEQTGIHILTTFMGKGTVSADDELHLGTVGLQERDYVMCGIEAADLIITIGKDYIEYAPENWNQGKDADIIHIGATPPEIDAYYVTALDLVGDVKATLEALNDREIPKNTSTYSTRLKEYIKDEFNKYADDDSFPMKPQRIVHDLRHSLAEDDILLTDVGAHKFWLSRLYPAYEPNTFIVSNGFASMGIALPGGIAATLAKPDRNVVAVCGDGGFLMNVQELETATRLNRDLVIVVFDDEQYAAITWDQLDEYGETYGSTFDNPDFVQLVESFGATGHRIEAAEALQPTLEDAIAAGGVHVIDVPVDPEENMKLTEELGDFVCPT